MGSFEKYLGTEQINHGGVRNLIQGGGTGNLSLWVRDVGDNPPHAVSPGLLPE